MTQKPPAPHWRSAFGSFDVKTSIKLGFPALLSLSLRGPAWANIACPIQQIYNHGDITFGAYTWHLIDADDPDNSESWAGPLVIGNKAGKTCTAEVGIIAPSFYDAGSHYLYVMMFSGSEAGQVLLDANTCAAIWTSPEFVGNPRQPGADRFEYDEAKPVVIGPDCLPETKTGFLKP